MTSIRISAIAVLSICTKGDAASGRRRLDVKWILGTGEFQEQIGQLKILAADIAWLS